MGDWVRYTLYVVRYKFRELLILNEKIQTLTTNN